MSEHGLLFDAMVYLTAAVLFVPLAGRLRLGSVLGYLAAGAVIGPWGFRFVRDVDSILHFAELGVVIMLFLIGLELDPRRLWNMRRAVFGGGTLQMIACGAVLGAPLLLALPWRAALVAGLTLALSSTAIAVQTMREQNLTSSPLGRVAFAVLLLQDMAAIPLIALVSLLSDVRAGSGDTGWMGLAQGAGAVVAVIVVGRYLTRPAMRIVAGTGMREVFTAFALLLVLGISALMAAAGVSMALGAFVAGVLLASSEYRHALETDLEPFKGLLMGLFFIAVGMSIDFGLLAHQPLLVATLVLGLLALKGAVLALIARPLGVDVEDRWLFAALLAQGGEFAFVVFGVVRQARLLPGSWDDLLTLAVALSMALTPLLVLLQRRYGTRTAPREADVVEHEHAPVIIAGFGRFGQIVGRLLFASGIRATVLDYSSDQIELLRRFGFRIFYGDATRLDLLHAAGAEHARLLVIAIDDADASLHLAKLVRSAFPNLELVVRARNVTHYLKLREAGIERIERETFESALKAGRRALEALGVTPFDARERADRFRAHNVAVLEQLLPHLGDEARRLTLAKAARQQFEQQFTRDYSKFDTQESDGWRDGADDDRADDDRADDDRADDDRDGGERR